MKRNVTDNHLLDCWANLSNLTGKVIKHRAFLDPRSVCCDYLVLYQYLLHKGIMSDTRDGDKKVINSFYL